MSRTISALRVAVFVIGVLAAAAVARAQHATISGRITDETGAALPAARVTVTDVATQQVRSVATNDSGAYALPLLLPGRYDVLVSLDGFRPITRRNLVLEADRVSRLDLVLRVSEVKEHVEVQALVARVGEPNRGETFTPEDLSKLPINGRDLQRIVTLAPGVLQTSPNNAPGGFSVNGQRTNANYYTVDGVSGNVAVETSPRFGFSSWGMGTTPGLSAFGGSNTLVPLNAVREIRVITSPLAPEYGRTPGAQVAVVSKSGSSRLTALAHEHFRDDALDATDWFVNAAGGAKPPLRFHDFGGSVGGPLGSVGLLFHASYEGQRLTVPQFRTSAVPDLAVRQRTSGLLRALLDGYPLPNGGVLGNGFSAYTAGWSDRSDSDALSLRVDVPTRERWGLFVRGHHGGSRGTTRTRSASNVVDRPEGQMTTVTVAPSFVIGRAMLAEARVNYTSNSYRNDSEVTAFGGAVPIDASVWMPSPSDVAVVGGVNITTGLIGNTLGAGLQGESRLRQLNSVGTVQWMAGSHFLKVGADYRHIDQTADIPGVQYSYVLGAPSTLTGNLVPRLSLTRGLPGAVRLRNLSVFAQDTWTIGPRASLTYGVRWDVNPAPRSNNDFQPILARGVSTPTAITSYTASGDLWPTDWTGVAPRLSVGWQPWELRGRPVTINAGAGLFYDIGWGNASAFGGAYPYNRAQNYLAIGAPPTPGEYPPLPSLSDPPGSSTIFAFDALTLPRTVHVLTGVEWDPIRNLTVGATYLGSNGERLIRSIRYGLALINPNYQQVQSFTNEGRSRYHAMRLQSNYRLSSLTARLAYTLSTSKDIGSSETALGSPATAVDPEEDWGPSDFDSRHNVQATFTWTSPPSAHPIWRDWSVSGGYVFRSAFPSTPVFFRDIGFGTVTLRPDLVPGVPLYLEDASFTGGRRYNPAAFITPTELRQGNAPRNLLRRFDLQQVDMSVSRAIRVPGRSRVELVADIFNVFNWPQFGSPSGSFGTAQFGLPSATAASEFGATTAARGLSGLFQTGGARSIQLGVRVSY